jgi:secreted PhoX family phosphatase
VVEIDPSDPTSVPVKRTAMGTFEHEGAAGIVNRDGRYVVYQGDERFDYVYRFVTEGRMDPANRAANRDLLEQGNAIRGAIQRRRHDAVAALGVWTGSSYRGQRLSQPGRRADRDTPRRRPAGRHENGPAWGVEANPKTNKVYVMPPTIPGARPSRSIPPIRGRTTASAISSSGPPDGDHAADRYTWDVLVRCGDPSVAAVGASFNPSTSKDGWFGMPDNCAVDAQAS